MSETGKIPAAMRAIVHGWTGGISLNSTYKTPVCGQSEVLLKVKAAAINPVDYKLGRLLGAVVGLDVSGVVEQVGDKVTEFKVGDEVYGNVQGSLADYVVAKPETLGLKPSAVSFVEAAAMPVAYLTSLQSIRDYGKLTPEGRILIIGASGGCGVAGLQVAKAMGAGHIVGVCSGKNEAFVKEQGANEVVDYTKEDVLDHFGELDEALKFDVVYDAATASGGGEDYKSKSLKLLKQNGQYVAINGAPTFWVRQFTVGQKKNEHLVVMSSKTAELDLLSELVVEGKIKPVIAEQFSLTGENAQKGFDLQKSRRVVGKIVFDMTKE
eukprot:GFUD01003884.1.p1 GENE.GFUD01003884.1~~GFUD01003884.1.p1  ORF type:complete len:324 (-),score=74.34 GFUD01003884.1:289-1260(-)